MSEAVHYWFYGFTLGSLITGFVVLILVGAVVNGAWERSCVGRGAAVFTPNGEFQWKSDPAEKDADKSGPPKPPPSER